MQTYSHALITGALSTPLKRRGYAVNTAAFLLGAALPDIPFFVLTVLGGIYFTWLAPAPTGENPSQREAVDSIETRNYHAG